MFGLLPDLTPRDSHSIWYTSSRNPVNQAAFLDAHEHRHPHDPHHSGHHGGSSRRAGQLLIERSALARLRADEQQLDRLRVSVQNFGSMWLKPPGVPKTLHQMREERKEQEEHAEAMRREQLAQELEAAEAAGQEDVLEDDDDDDDRADIGGGLDAIDEELRNLDDDIPEAEEGSFGFDGGDDSDTDNLSSSVGDGDDDDAGLTGDVDVDGGGVGGGGGGGGQSDDREERRGELVAARMRMADDAFRQAMARGDADGADMYGADEEELEAEGRGQILDEEDLLARADGVGGGDDDLGMDMDADLDDDIPDAGELSGVYEHTDSEAGLSSSSSSGGGDDDEEEEEEEDLSFAPRASAAPLRPPPSPTRERGGPRSSIDLSGLLSADGSSVMDSSVWHSSPNVRAQRR